MTLFPFVAFTYVDQSKTVVRIQLIANFLNGYFLYLFFCFVEKLFKVAHVI